MFYPTRCTSLLVSDLWCHSKVRTRQVRYASGVRSVHGRLSRNNSGAYRHTMNPDSSTETNTVVISMRWLFFSDSASIANKALLLSVCVTRAQCSSLGVDKRGCPPRLRSRSHEIENPQPGPSSSRLRRGSNVH